MSAKRTNQDQYTNAKGRRAGKIAGIVTGFALMPVLGWLGLAGIAMCVGAGVVVNRLVSVMASGLDTTTHNREDREREVRQEQIRSIPTAGDENVDPIVVRGREMLEQICAVNDSIPDARLSYQMDQLVRVCSQIFKTVAERPAKAGQIRKFMNYYLPTTLKMLNQYKTMQNRGVSANQMYEMRQTLVRGLDMVLGACQKLLDNLYKDSMLDVSTDIDVLEQMLKRDGLTGDAPTEPILQTGSARTAAAQQLQTGTPSQKTPADQAGSNDDDDFPSYFQQLHV